MGIINYTALSTRDELLGFSCGNSSIDQLVANSFYPNQYRQIMAYKMSIQNIRVGFFSVSVQGISLEDTDTSVAEYYYDNPSFAAVKLEYIAIDKRIQKRGIGTTALEYIVQEARKLYVCWPIRLLILDAVRDKVSWYENRGFEPIDRADMNSASATVPMYLDLMPEDEKTVIIAESEEYYE
ncbi:GNAT family N-acetyltransferase [Sharpea azabuensis]